MSCLCPATHFHNILARFVLGCCLIFASVGVQFALAHSATLRWASNTEPDLIGYKVYQGTTPGSYGLAVDVGNTTIYTTQNLQNGRRYYFAITAYDKSGNESSPSTEVSLQTPPPLSASIQPSITSVASATANVNEETFLADWKIAGVGNLDGDARADIVVRNRKTGDAGGWLGNGLTLGSTGLIAAGVATEWSIAGLGDLDGDGKDDIVVRNTSTGDVGAWLGNGLTLGATGLIAMGVPAEWIIAGLGDLDGDGKDDIVVRDTSTGDVGVWIGNGLTLGATGLIAVGVPAEWSIAGLGDLGGDGKDDIVVRNTSTGDVGVWFGNGVNEPTQTGVIGGSLRHWAIVGISDMDDDGQSDIVWRDTTDGSVVVWQGNGMNAPTTVNVLAASVPTSWEIVGVGDLEGNGRADIVWRNKADGSVAVWQGNGLNAPTTASVLAGSGPLKWETPS